MDTLSWGIDQMISSIAQTFHKWYARGDDLQVGTGYAGRDDQGVNCARMVGGDQQRSFWRDTLYISCLERLHIFRDNTGSGLTKTEICHMAVKRGSQCGEAVRRQ